MLPERQLVEVETGYYSRKETARIPLANLPHLRLSDQRGQSVIAVAALAQLPNPFEPWHMLPFEGDRVFFLLERSRRRPKLLGARPKQGIAAEVLLDLESRYVLANRDGSFVLCCEDESVNCLIPVDEATRLRQWLPGALKTAIARVGVRSRLSALA